MAKFSEDKIYSTLEKYEKEEASRNFKRGYKEGKQIGLKGRDFKTI